MPHLQQKNLAICRSLIRLTKNYLQPENFYNISKNLGGHAQLWEFVYLNGQNFNQGWVDKICKNFLIRPKIVKISKMS